MFFDEVSETIFEEIPKSALAKSRVLLNIGQFEIGESYVTAKIRNRYFDNVTMNIQGGKPGIELQESLFKIKDNEHTDQLHYAYISTTLNSGKTFIRKLPVIGFRDWLLIYEDTLVELSVADAYDELEIIVV
ncbi:MAG TPA: hypothetical protein VF220_02705 [Nitrososphaeraceae archaeon]